MTRISRIKNINRGPKGESCDKENLDYWARRAERNSYHGGGNEPKAKGPGRNDLNHDPDNDYLPKVRRVD